MKNIKTFEAFSLIPKYFSKENTEIRNKKKKITNKLKSLMEKGYLVVYNTQYNNGNTEVTPIFEPGKYSEGPTMKTNKYGRIGNTFIKTNKGVGFFQINDDGTIDVYGSVNIQTNYISPSNLFDDIKFNIIVGDFKMIYYQEFNHLPEKVYGSLILRECGIDSFKQLPTKEIYGNLNVSGNNLEDFEDMPKFKGTKAHDIDISQNDIYTLDFFPIDLNIDVFDYYLNPISYIKIEPTDGYDYDGDDSLISYLLSDLRRGGYNYDLFKDYDPIHPPDSTSGKRPNGCRKSIIYLDRINGFLEEVGFKPINIDNQIKNYYTLR